MPSTELLIIMLLKNRGTLLIEGEDLVAGKVTLGGALRMSAFFIIGYVSDWWVWDSSIWGEILLPRQIHDLTFSPEARYQRWKSRWAGCHFVARVCVAAAAGNEKRVACRCGFEFRCEGLSIRFTKFAIQQRFSGEGLRAWISWGRIWWMQMRRRMMSGFWFVVK
jgi:hypothetical protein